MEKSESIKNIASALITFQVKVGKITKDATNPFFKSKYASLANIQDAIAEPLEEAGISYMQFPDGIHGLTTIVMHGESGEWLQSTYTMKPVKDDPQGIGSCITYQKRYALAGALALTIDDDDDGNSATHGAATPAKLVDKQKADVDKTARDINSYIAKTKECKTVDELKKIKSEAPAHVRASKEWNNVATEKYISIAPKKEAVA